MVALSLAAVLLITILGLILGQKAGRWLGRVGKAAKLY